MTIRLVDVRRPNEFASGHIAGSELVPLATLQSACKDWDRSAPVQLVCKSGMRAEIARAQLANLGFTHISVLQGGIDSWRRQGKPLVGLVGDSDGTTAESASSFSDQILIASGVAVLVTVILARTVSPLFYFVTAVVGAAVTLDAITNKGITETLVSRLPWNRSSSSREQLR